MRFFQEVSSNTTESCYMDVVVMKSLSLNPLVCLFISQRFFLSSSSSEFTLFFFFLHRFYVDLFSGSSNLRGMSYELSSADVDSSSKLVSLAGTSLQSRNSLGQILSWIQTAGRQRASFKWLCQLDQWAKTVTTKTSVQILTLLGTKYSRSFMVFL